MRPDCATPAAKPTRTAVTGSDLVVVNRVGPGIKPRLRLIGPTSAPRVAVADAALLADVHALLARVAERLR